MREGILETYNCIFIPIGTICYGKVDQKEDMSFITTLWIVVFFIPIIPIRRYRVFELGTPKTSDPDTAGAVCVSYKIIERLPSDRKQVIRTYLFLVFEFFWLYLIYFIVEKYNLFSFSNPVMIMAETFLLVVLASIPLILVADKIPKKAWK